MNSLTTKVTAVSSLKEIKIIIRSELESLVDGFIALGFYLKKARDEEMFREEGYENIYEFAKAEYNLSKSTVSRYMAINDRFSIDGNSPELSDEFRGFGSSKLSEMLVLTDEQLKNITPDATREDIRDYKKIVSENEVVAPAQHRINTQLEGTFNTPKNSLNEFIIGYFKEEGKSIFEKVISIILSSNDKETNIMYAIAPSKFKLIRLRGGISVICNSDSVTIMKIGLSKETYNYSELIQEFINVFLPDRDKTAAEIYKEYYNEDLYPVKVEVKISDPKVEEQQQVKVTEKRTQEDKTSVKKPIEKKQVEKVLYTQSEEDSEDETIDDEDVEDYEDFEEETEEEEKDSLADAEIPGQNTIEDYPEYLPEKFESLKGEVIQDNSKADDYVIILANKLQKVINAKQEFLKQVAEYKSLAAGYGVTEDAITYILKEVDNITTVGEPVAEQ